MTNSRGDRSRTSKFHSSSNRTLLRKPSPGAPRTKISRVGWKLKQNRAQATFKRNICDAKVTLGGMATKGMETPRISRIPATKQRVFDQKLTSRSPTIHASMLSFAQFGRDIRKSGQGRVK
ncbi:hypothetical protein [Mesorhizobium sp. 113-3-9]|uniref:hypothetical protein n=1 Tax=Mesorhizobium sp. 113-3-9 TaxID=2744517 RepID=UPI001927389A|nr:hypothetical protein [Mesorhizobium sp. 113-3-9]